MATWRQLLLTCNMSSTLMILGAVFGVYWVSKSNNRAVQFAGLMLSLSLFLKFVPVGFISQYADYPLAFFTLFAGFEPTNSFRFKRLHKLSFGYASVTIFLFLVKALIELPLKFPFEVLLLPIPIITFWLWRNEKKVVYQRISYMIIWSTLAIIALYQSQWLRELLSELF